MPRVTPEYRAKRQAEIIAAAARRFARDGFHATSMADIVTETGLSPGAVYLYFRSKEEIIDAVARTALTAADEVFATLLADGAAPSPAETVTTLIETAVSKVINDPVTGSDLTRVAVHVWGEALRNPDLQARTGDIYRRLRANCAEVARRWQAAGNMPADAVPEQVGAAMLALVQGFLLQRLLLSGTTAADYLGGVRGLLAASERPTGGTATR